jgi:hypothetical protein
MKTLSNHSNPSFFYFANLLIPRFLFRAFFENENLFEKYLNQPHIKSKILESPHRKAFLIKCIIEDIRKTDSTAGLYLLYEFILAVDPTDEQNKIALIIELRKQIKDNFRGRQFREFEEFLNKIIPHDQIYEKYFRMYARQMLKADVVLDEWQNLLEEAKFENSNIQRNIISQLITKHLHMEDLEKSIELFKHMIQLYDVIGYDVRVVIGIFKLAIKQKKFEEAKKFRKYVSKMKWKYGFHYFAKLKLVEVMAELDLADKHMDHKDGDLWKGMFEKLKKLRTIPENKLYIQELKHIYRELNKKHDLLLDIRISTQEQKKLYDLIEKKLVMLIHMVCEPQRSIRT